MEQKHDNRYRNLSLYAQELHEKNKKRVKVSGIVLILLPVILGLIRWLTDSDKIVFLIIWILCMFAVCAYLVSVEYLDHVLQKRLHGLTGRDEEYDSLLDGQDFIPSELKEKVRAKMDSDTADKAEEGEDE